MSRSKDVPGNSRESARLHAEWLARIGQAVARLDRWVDHPPGDQPYLLGFTLKFPQGLGDDCLVIVRAVKEGTRLVAFHAAQEPADALKGALERYNNQSLKFRKDKYGNDAA